MVTAWTSSAALFVTILATGLTPLFFRWKSHHLDVFLSFGAGVLLSAAFLHMFPDATQQLGARAGVWVLAGFLALFTVEKLTMAHACGEHACPNHKVGLSALLGLSVHSVIAGMALGAALSGTATIATAMLFAVLVHKVPETLALMALFLSSHWSRGKALAGLTWFAAMGPVGIFLSRLGVDASGSRDMPAILLAASTGTFLYIASSDLLPHLHRK
ncbi:MAG: ZIP family metal transporter, partial [Bdellovibrionales bacterium]|nr:ZIP family metal transporter [Bdellovibrionales bacterium]